MTPEAALRIAAFSGFTAVLLGAFGAHGLKEMLVRHDATAIWQTAVLYHLVHSVVLLFIAGSQWISARAFRLFTTGIVVFSGSLYLLSVTNVRWLGAITPLGGLALLGGWLALALSARSSHDL